MTKPLRWKPKFHLMPPTGWLNDPNGLCQFHGIYHVFFQYRPGSALGTGETGWGHYTSPDLLHWTFQGMPLRPDQYFDRDGVYSGSALIDDDTLLLFYTGNVKHPGDFDYISSGREANVVLVTSPDGITFSEKEPLLGNADYPSACTCHVRDPKVWKDGPDYYMVLGARLRGVTSGRSDTSNYGDTSAHGDTSDYGGVLLYHSTDCRRFHYVNTITSPEPFGYMWECPDLFSIDGHQLLSLSPQGLRRESHRFQNIYQSGYFTVDGDINGTYTLSDFKEWDMGFDFYAPQTFCDEQGRRILIGWMGLPDIKDEYSNPTVQDGWQHILTIPREIFVNQTGAICQRPIAEFETLRQKEHTLADQSTLTIATPFDLIVTPDGSEDDTTITLYGGALQISCSPVRGEYSMAFTPHASSPGHGRTIRRAKLPNTPAQIRVLCDTSAVEVFFGDGETVMSTRIYPDTDTPATLTITGATARLWELNIH